MSRINIEPSSAAFCCPSGSDFKRVNVLFEKNIDVTSIENTGTIYIELSSKDDKVFSAKINPKKLHDEEVRNRIKMMLK